MSILPLQPCVAISEEAPLTTAGKGLVRTVTSSSVRWSVEENGPSVAPRVRRRCPLEADFQTLLWATKNKPHLSTSCNRQTSKLFLCSVTKGKRGGEGGGGGVKAMEA